MRVMMIVLCLLLSACNTMQGFGKDVEKLGGSISSTAEKARD